MLGFDAADLHRHPLREEDADPRGLRFRKPVAGPLDLHNLDQRTTSLDRGRGRSAAAVTAAASVSTFAASIAAALAAASAAAASLAAAALAATSIATAALATAAHAAARAAAAARLGGGRRPVGPCHSRAVSL